MAQLKVIRQIDNTGRIGIPRDLRRSFNISKDTEILLTVTECGILLMRKDTADKYGEQIALNTDDRM